MTYRSTKMANGSCFPTIRSQLNSNYAMAHAETLSFLRWTPTVYLHYHNTSAAKVVVISSITHDAQGAHTTRTVSIPANGHITTGLFGIQYAPILRLDIATPTYITVAALHPALSTWYVPAYRTRRVETTKTLQAEVVV